MQLCLAYLSVVVQVTRSPHSPRGRLPGRCQKREKARSLSRTRIYHLPAHVAHEKVRDTSRYCLLFHNKHFLANLVNTTYFALCIAYWCFSGIIATSKSRGQRPKRPKSESSTPSRRQIKALKAQSSNEPQSSDTSDDDSSDDSSDYSSDYSDDDEMLGDFRPLDQVSFSDNTID